MEMYSMIFDNRIEQFSYLVLMVGTAFDQITTKIGLSKYGLCEANALTLSLMNKGIWTAVDILICFVFIVVLHQSYRIVLEKKSNFLFVFPVISGLVRLSAGFMNMSLF